jgi:hypothetical protein
MSLSDRFIRNPVLTTVCSLVILLIGGVEDRQSIASNTSSDGISNLNIIGERRYALRI